MSLLNCVGCVDCMGGSKNFKILQEAECVITLIAIMSYNKNNKYQTKHNKNRYYNAISCPNLLICLLIMQKRKIKML